MLAGPFFVFLRAEKYSQLQTFTRLAPPQNFWSDYPKPVSMKLSQFGLGAISFDMFFMPLNLAKFRYWQVMFNPHPEVSTPAFCAESCEADSVN